ncbi:Formamidopyrimidine-DNA glycosylase [compost metagenome]
MPELPDLEVFAANLEKRLKNKTLEKLEVTVSKKLNVSEQELKAALEGHQLKAVSREGKTLQLHFGTGQVLGLHLMLHGELKLVEADAPPKFQIITLHFKGGDALTLTDFQRQATPTLNPEAATAPDALSKEMSVDYLKALLAKKGTSIKNVLMDQQLIRGIGNSYADEILWEARISPFSVAKAIPERKVKVLHKAIEDVLRQEIILLSKVLKDDFSGEIREFLKIHNAGNKNSPTGEPILVEKKSGRKTYYTNEQELYQ